MSSFEILDANQDGRISKKELRDAAFLIGLNPTNRELEAWWREADTNSECADVSLDNVKTTVAIDVAIDVKYIDMKVVVVQFQW